MKTFLLLLGILILTACGGGGSGSSPVDCRVSRLHYSDVPELIAYGDSTMVQSYRMLQEQLAAKGVTVEYDNRAVGGTQLYQLIDGSCHYPNGFATDLDDEPAARVVVENYGINDAHFLYPPAEYEKRVRVFVKVVRDAGMVPVLITPIRTLNATYVPPAHLATLAQIKRDIAQELQVKVVDVYNLPVTTQDFQSDLIHPTPNFYERIANYTANCIKDLF